MTNYFFIYRPFQLHYAKKIISLHHKNENNFLVNHFTSGSSAITTDNNTTIIHLSRSIINRILHFRKIKKAILAKAKNGEAISIFIPHTLGILSNYAYYVLAKKYKNVKLNLFYEGVIFFYKYNHNIKNNLSYYLSRSIAGLFSGMPYNINGDLLDLQNSKIYKIYSPFLNIAAPAEKIIETELDNLIFVPKVDFCVILGHGINAPIDLQKKLISALYCKISELQIKNIYLKDHPYEKCDIFHTLAKENNIKINIIDSILPIENIIIQYAPKYVFSLWSSSIVNLKKTLPSDVEVFSIVNEEIIKSHKIEELIQVFHQQEIKVIYV